MRVLIADTTALVPFLTATGVVNERFVAGMEWDEVALARAIGAPLVALTARPYGLWRDAMLARFASGTSASLALWDTIALLLFQVPIYVAIIAVGGAAGAELLRGALRATAIMLVLVLGRPYGAWLDLVRSWFGLPPGSMKPMSPRR